MKTPDEIKKGLECCTHNNCNACPYRDKKVGCRPYRNDDALALIQQLEADKQQLEGLCNHMNQLRDAAAGRALKMEERVHQLEAQVPRWISVEERLPEIGTWVLCWYVDIDGDKWHTVGRLLTDGIWGVDIYETDEPEYYTVTHWMPLPEAPKEE